MSKKPEFLVGLDVGTYRVAAVVAELRDGGPAIIGVGTAPCEGVRKGVVVNIDATAHGIEAALKEAELAAGVEIHSVFTDVSGEHIRGLNSHGVVGMREPEVTAAEVERVVEKARSIPLPEQLEVLHVLPQDFVVDGSAGIRSPIGMAGSRLEAHVHIVTTAAPSARNVVRCCERLGLHVADLVLAPLAAAEAVLGPDEKEAGVAVLDIGAGTTDVLVFRAGAPWHTAVLPFGGHHVTSDVAAGLRTPFRDAEVLKQRHGTVSLAVPGGDDPSVEVPSVGARGARLISRQKLAHIIEARMEEILTLARGQIAKCGLLEDLGSGVVITGGTALLGGLIPLGERVFQCPVRIGAPIGIVDEASAAGTAMPTDPSLSAAVGLVLYGVRPLDQFFDFRADRKSAHGRTWAEAVRRWWSAISRRD